MDTKEMIKKDIDALPENALAELQKTVRSLKLKANRPKQPAHTIDLKGQFDHVDIRKIAYE